MLKFLLNLLRRMPDPRRSALLFLSLLLASVAQAQTCSIPGNAGTLVSTASELNSYFPGTGNAAVASTSIAVGAGVGFADIAPGDLMLIIQMQGADINATNSNAYGDGTTDAGVTSTVAYLTAGYAGGNVGTNFIAGTYEWAVATSTKTLAGAGTVDLSAPLQNAYFTRAGSSTQGKQAFQVIRVPQYANLTLSAGLTARPWNGSTGGVIALDTTGDLNLNGQTIEASGSGFRGAGSIQQAPQCTTDGGVTACPEYVSLGALQLGGFKGEGLAGTPGRLYTNDFTGAGTGIITPAVGPYTDGYLNGDGSRGAPGNAGGGGNQHNAGGGGGGNGGSGGNGGNSWNGSTSSFFGRPVGGFGGAPSGNVANRWIMGGGGGAGDVGGNGFTAPDGSGGSGGGLVILRASRVVGGNSLINVNGVAGQRARATDAGGGGGAGGTVVIAAGAGGLSGALTVNAAGGLGGAYQVVGLETDGPGGGGGGGVLIANVAGVTFNSAGGAAGTSASTAGCAGTNCGARAAVAGGSQGYAIVSPGVQVGYECLPNLTVVKSTLNPLITATTGATADYVVTIRNSGGGARFVDLLDTALPPGWTLAAPAPTYAYSPVQPLAAGVLSSGAETSASTTTSRTWVVAATPLSIPAAGANSLTWSSFAVAPIRSGAPSVVTVTFRVSIPDAATVGTYHNGAGVTFLDPTRSGTTRTVSPLTAVNANRSGTPYSANTTYANFNGLVTTNVAGANYSGLVAGPTSEDVRLLPDLSISKSAPTSAVVGATFTYTLTPQNNGRAIAQQVFAASQATDASAGVLASSPLTITDTLPVGLSPTGAFNGVNWTCTGTSTVVCTLPDSSAYPIAAATNFAQVTGTVLVTCPGADIRTNTVIISPGSGETQLANNTGVFTTTITPTCVNAALTVVKSNGVSTLVAGQSTSYTITVANEGPGAAGGTTLKDPVVPGLSCTANPTCTATAGAACPTSLAIGSLQGPGLIIPTLNATSSVTFVLTCGVTATGL